MTERTNEQKEILENDVALAEARTILDCTLRTFNALKITVDGKEDHTIAYSGLLDIDREAVERIESEIELIEQLLVDLYTYVAQTVYEGE